MKLLPSILSLWMIAVCATQAALASKVPPPLRMEEVAGEWIGQCQFGDVFHLTLNEDGTGTLGYVRAWDEQDTVTVYDVTEVTLGRGTIRIDLAHERWGKMRLEGYAQSAAMSLRIKGLYRRAKPELHLVRPEAWDSVVGRLRSGVVPK